MVATPDDNVVVSFLDDDDDDDENHAGQWRVWDDVTFHAYASIASCCCCYFFGKEEEAMEGGKLTGVQKQQPLKGEGSIPTPEASQSDLLCRTFKKTSFVGEASG